MKTPWVKITWAMSWKEFFIVYGGTIALVGLLLLADDALARTVGYPLTLDFWLQNTVVRKATIYQCQRRGPGDQLVFIYCGIASKAELITLQHQTAQQQQWHR